MATPGQTRCAYCRIRADSLSRLNSTELLEFMKNHNRTYTRRTLFCAYCIGRVQAKFKDKKIREKLRQRKAMSSISDGTASYSNVSNADLSSSSSPRRNPSRNVSKRTAGPPRNRSSTTSGQENNNPDSSDDDDDDDGGMVIVLPDTADSNTSDQQRNSSNSRSTRQSTSGQSTSRQSTARRSTQSHTSNVDYGNDDDYDPDDNGHANGANQTGDGGSVSTLAPMPSYRYRRTQSLSSSAAAVSPSRMANMSSTERSETLRNYKRTGGG